MTSAGWSPFTLFLLPIFSVISDESAQMSSAGACWGRTEPLCGFAEVKSEHVAVGFRLPIQGVLPVSASMLVWGTLLCGSRLGGAALCR